MFWKSLRNEVVGVLLAILMGILMGIPLSLIQFDKEATLVEWGNPEMMSRGIPASLWSGIAVAVPCGAGAALSVTQGGSMAIIGVAISAALLPPVRLPA
jgi:uncharacterized membrane protein